MVGGEVERPRPVLQPARAASSIVACSICSGPIEPYKPIAYLHTGAVVHVRCRISSHGAAGSTVAIVQPSTHAMQRRVREVRAAARATRAMLRSLAVAAGPVVATVDQGPRGRPYDVD
jgi:hypothetical protein